MATGDELFKKAGSKVGKMFFNDPEAAYELYQQAGAMYKAEKNWDKSGESFMAAGDLAMKLKDPGGACNNYMESATVYKKVDVTKAQTLMGIAIDLCIKNNRLATAAKLHKDFAEQAEQDGQIEVALRNYSKAYDYFYAEDQNSSALQCKAKIAKMICNSNKYEEAIPLLEEMAGLYLDGPLKHQATEFYVKAMYCRLATVKSDAREEAAAALREVLDSYTMNDGRFRNSREEEVMQSLIDAVETQDVTKFDDVIDVLNEHRMMDDWKANTLLIIKANIENTC